MLFKKKRKLTSIEKELKDEAPMVAVKTPKNLPKIEDIETPKVRIYSKQGEELRKNKMNEKEKRMAELLQIISIAGQTERYLVCVTVHDPKNVLKREGGDLHHWVFQQEFPKDDRYGCLDEYANLMKLGDR